MSNVTFEEKFNGIFSITVLLLTLSIGVGGIYNCCIYNNRTIQQGEKKKITKMYGPTSRLEITYEKGLAKEVLKSSILGSSTKFELDGKGSIKTITETSYDLLGKVKIKVSNPKDYALKDRNRLNEDIENYLKYLKK